MWGKRSQTFTSSIHQGPASPEHQLVRVCTWLCRFLFHSTILPRSSTCWATYCQAFLFPAQQSSIEPVCYFLPILPTSEDVPNHPPCRCGRGPCFFTMLVCPPPLFYVYRPTNVLPPLPYPPLPSFWNSPFLPHPLPPSIFPPYFPPYFTFCPPIFPPNVLLAFRLGEENYPAGALAFPFFCVRDQTRPTTFFFANLHQRSDFHFNFFASLVGPLISPQHPFHLRPPKNPHLNFRTPPQFCLGHLPLSPWNFFPFFSKVPPSLALME